MLNTSRIRIQKVERNPRRLRFLCMMGRQKSKAVDPIPSTPSSAVVVVVVVVHVGVAIHIIEMEIAILPIQEKQRGEPW